MTEVGQTKEALAFIFFFYKEAARDITNTMNYPLWNKIPKNPTIDIYMFNIDLLIYYRYSETRPYLKI